MAEPMDVRHCASATVRKRDSDEMLSLALSVTLLAEDRISCRITDRAALEMDERVTLDAAPIEAMILSGIIYARRRLGNIRGFEVAVTSISGRVLREDVDIVPALASVLIAQALGRQDYNFEKYLAGWDFLERA